MRGMHVNMNAMNGEHYDNDEDSDGDDDSSDSDRYDDSDEKAIAP